MIIGAHLEAVSLRCDKRLRIVKMHMLGIPKGGRSGDVVFLMIRNRERERAFCYSRKRAQRGHRARARGFRCPVEGLQNSPDRPTAGGLDRGGGESPELSAFEPLLWWSGDPNGTRTRAAAVKGRCPNR
jgi:hypothetical protein